MDILENMKKNDKFIGDVLAPFEQALGMKFNKFDKPQDPKYVEPKKKNLKLNLKKAERKQAKLAKMNPEQAKQVHWKNAIDKAQGVKIKDDPKIIKKVIKRKSDEKRRHQKQWAERLGSRPDPRADKRARGVKGRGDRRGKGGDDKPKGKKGKGDAPKGRRVHKSRGKKR